MRDEEIQQKIASFPRWHYEFDLAGHKTPLSDPRHAVRHRQRDKYFFEPLVDLLGGSLAGKRVLDLGCNAGFWSLRAVEAGCEFVLGIDGRQMHIDQANFVFEAKAIGKEKYDFLEANLFELDFRTLGTFDVVLCLGLMYHISKPVELMERIASVNTDVLVVDTVISRAKGSFLQLRREDLDDPRNALDRALVTVPTRRAVNDLTQEFGYSMATLKPDFRNERGEPDWLGVLDYRDGRRRAFLCTKRTDLSRLTVEVEPIESDAT